MKNFSAVFESLAEIVAGVVVVVFFLMMFAVVGCDKASNPILQQDEFAEGKVEENVVSVSRSYKIIADSGALYAYRTDLDENSRIKMAIIEQIDVFSVALYETPLISVVYPVALLVVGVPSAHDGKGVVYVFSISPEGCQLQEEIVPFYSSTLGFGAFVQFEHVDDAGWWLSVESVDGESFSAPIGRWF